MKRDITAAASGGGGCRRGASRLTSGVVLGRTRERPLTARRESIFHLQRLAASLQRTRGLDKLHPPKMASEVEVRMRVKSPVLQHVRGEFRRALQNGRPFPVF